MHRLTQLTVSNAVGFLLVLLICIPPWGFYNTMQVKWLARKHILPAKPTLVQRLGKILF